MNTGLVTTIIPVHNRSQQLREAVESVLAQDWRPIEILIVDDGSTDDTPRVAHELAAQHPAEVRVLRRDNGGPGAARETGRLAANGEFIQHLDSDDVLLAGKFRAQVAALRSHPRAHVAYGITLLRRSGIRIEGPHKRTGEVFDTMFPLFLVERWWDTSTPLYRRGVIDAAGPWTGLRVEEDWEYDCRIAASGARLVHVNAPVSETREHDGSRLSGAATRASLRDRARAQALIHSHATRFGIASDSAPMQQFARSAFLLARQCGAAGLARESCELFELAREAAGVRASSSIDYRVYGAGATVLGWRFMGRASAWLDLIRNRHA